VQQIKFEIQDLEKLKKSLLLNSKKFEHVSILDSNNYGEDKYSEFEYIAGFGAQLIVTSNNWNDLEVLRKRKTWLFGFLSYDLKNQLEELKSENPDQLNFPEICFFEPEILVQIKNNICTIKGNNISTFKSELDIIELNFSYPKSKIEINSRISKEKYIKQVIQLLNHIQLGDIFEVNFCQEFFAEQADIYPEKTFLDLIKKSPVPFSSFFKLNNKYSIGASPERFIKRVGDAVISQPIKGTSKRGSNKEEDDRLKKALITNKKERSENVMIVDLVRNDFSRFAKKGTVEVKELLAAYSFPQVHQLISTISCEAEGISSVEVIKNCFPMGSMTGAPKLKAMELIENYESVKRGLYSGAIGFIKPNGDFDFNVVIRSILYNSSNKYLSFLVGGAITNNSIPETEYEESLLKAKAIFEVLNNN
jgi:para-aminobenzoate synthetase component 1